jgi:FCD domain-containing protein
MELFSSSLDKAANALEALNASMGVALQNDDLLAWAKADDEFHRLLVVSCGNRRIARIAETIMHQSHRAKNAHPQTVARNGSTREHRVCPTDGSFKCRVRIQTFTFTGLIFGKAKPDLRREEDPRFGDFFRRSC